MSRLMNSPLSCVNLGVASMKNSFLRWRKDQEAVAKQTIPLIMSPEKTVLPAWGLASACGCCGPSQTRNWEDVSIHGGAASFAQEKFWYGADRKYLGDEHYDGSKCPGKSVPEGSRIWIVLRCAQVASELGSRRSGRPTKWCHTGSQHKPGITQSHWHDRVGEGYN